jgi:signal transduction histidine kinase/DNA-binding LacI/PurR family transcriptional regulator
MPEQPRPVGVFSRYLSGYYFGALISGIHQVTRSAGVPLVVTHVIHWPTSDQRLPTFSIDHVAGWIFIHPLENDRANLAALCAAAAPVVMAPVPLEGMPCTLVQVDNRGGMRAAVEHLIDHGHRRIAYVDHGPEVWSQQRYQGYCDALAARGIAHDPALVMSMDVARDHVDLHQQRGEHAARQLLEHGLPCTALAASTDRAAIAVMQILQAAGYRMPDDLAVVGFDDLIQAQYTRPPLTTVRCSFDAIGRAAAIQVLAEIRGGRAAYPQIISVPTTLLQRRSCGCTTLDDRLAGVGATHPTSASWQATLIQQLVQAVQYPLPLDPAIPPAQLWPGAGVLVAAIDAIIQRQPPPTSASIEIAWQQAIGQTENLEALHIALTLLEDAAEQRLAATPNHTIRQAMTTLLRRIRLELMRARLAHEIWPKQYLGDQVRANHVISMALLNSSIGDAQVLRWLASTPAIWGCLGLWDEAPSAGATTLTIAGAYHRDAMPSSVVGQHVAATAFPPIHQLPLSAQQGQDLIILCPIRTETRDWGALALCGWADRSLLTIGHGERTENLLIQATLLGTTLDRNAAALQNARLYQALEQTNRDLAAAKATAEQANTFKSQFLATMSHELRTPLNAIRNFARFLNKEAYGPLTARQTDLQQRILTNADHLLTVLNDILDLSKIEAGRMDLVVEQTALAPILHGVLATIGGLAKDKGLNLSLEVADALPLVMIDKTRIRQVLLNLLANAVKFTEQGGITVRATPTDDGMVCIRVTDSGPGIASAHQALVFEEFRQVEDAQRLQQGSGLGLPISKRLVELHGGRLWLESTAGEGATFAFTLPISPAAPAAAVRL